MRRRSECDRERPELGGGGRDAWRGQFTSPQVSEATLNTMAGPGELNSARLRRDLSLALRRRLTIAAGVGATGLTVVFSLIAATSAPGRTAPAGATQPDPTSNAQQLPSDNQPSFNQPGLQQPSFQQPSQAPQSGFGGRPVTISGGS
jgi:hypothetical protein